MATASIGPGITDKGATQLLSIANTNNKVTRNHNLIYITNPIYEWSTFLGTCNNVKVLPSVKLNFLSYRVLRILSNLGIITI